MYTTKQRTYRELCTVYTPLEGIVKRKSLKKNHKTGKNKQNPQPRPSADAPAMKKAALAGRPGFFSTGYLLAS
jgi:hypothetical protein